MYIIKDWADNLMNFGEFKSFQDAWDYLYIEFESEKDDQEFYVEFKEK